MIIAYRQAEIHDFPLLTATVEDTADRHEESVVVRSRQWERLYRLVISAYGVRLELANERPLASPEVGRCAACARIWDDWPARSGIGTGCPACGHLSDAPDFVGA